MKTYTHNKLSELFANIIYTAKKWFLPFALFLVIMLLAWTAYVEYVQGKSYVSGPIATLAPPNIKRAMLKMGPRHEFRLRPSGRLEVKLNGQWLRLRY